MCSKNVTSEGYKHKNSMFALFAASFYNLHYQNGVAVLIAMVSSVRLVTETAHP